MAILGNIFIALAKVISLIVGVYTFIVAGAVIVSWVRADPYNPIVNFLYQATEPVFSRCRRFLPGFLYRTGIDWTPMIVIIVLIFLETVISGSLRDIGLSLKFGDQPSLPEALEVR